MPGVQELQGILDFGHIAPSINTEYFPNTQWSKFFWWSDTPDPWYGAWYVSFGYGSAQTAEFGTAKYVRLVRSPAQVMIPTNDPNMCVGNLAIKIQTNPDSMYQVHHDGTVTDIRTNLMWKQCSEGQTWQDDGSTYGTCYDPHIINKCSAVSSPSDILWEKCEKIRKTYLFNWQRALALTPKSSYAGHNDWRLPNVKELRSLVEQCRSNPAINTNIFPNTPLASWYHTSSPYLDPMYNRDQMWLIGFSVGNNTIASRGGWCYIRLVRDAK